MEGLLQSYHSSRRAAVPRDEHPAAGHKIKRPGSLWITIKQGLKTQRNSQSAVFIRKTHVSRRLMQERNKTREQHSLSIMEHIHLL